MVEAPFQLPVTKPDMEKANAKMGVSQVLFNVNGSLLATVNESQPKVIWVWDIPTLQLLCVVQQTLPIKSVQWNPLLPDQFSFCCGNGMVYLWERKFGCDAVQVPAGNLLLISSISDSRIFVESRWEIVTLDG
jgi:WD40 repeat protein